ncbi:unnamed protein product [Lasius platythorax]|uniref:Uncharacterized protein n=1 Tax=Lasius platythorax TaxID=488582 RepID=A0AAV2P0A9_9HYME
MQAVRSHGEGRDFEGGSEAQANLERPRNIVGSAAATKRVSLRVQTNSTRYIQVLYALLRDWYVLARCERHSATGSAREEK